MLLREDVGTGVRLHYITNSLLVTLSKYPSEV